MFSLEKIVRKNILNLEPYSSARDEFSTGSSTSEYAFLDANENPFGELNRYPDPYQRELKEKLCEKTGVPVNQIFIGNGSDEIIDLTFRLFCQPGIDKALTFSPTYGMYKVSANLNDVELIEVPLNDQFDIDPVRTSPFLNDPSIKLIFICSPNNPTGNCMSPETLDTLLRSFDGMVVLDEAYIDFASTSSWIETLNDYPNLIVIQTFSKARGLAAARIGTAYASREVIALLNRVKPPYNVSALNQTAAITALRDNESFIRNREVILEQRNKLEEKLRQMDSVKRVYPSEANFLLIEVENAQELYDSLVVDGVIVRNRDSLVHNCLRVSVGTEVENSKLIKSISKKIVKA